MEFWLSASLFFGGAVSYWAIANLLTLGHAYGFVKGVTDQIVLLLISTSQDVAFLKKLKYDTMRDMDMSEEQIKTIKKLDEESFKEWKDINLLKIIQLYPKHFKKILEEYNWDIVTKSTDDLYK